MNESNGTETSWCGENCDLYNYMIILSFYIYNISLANYCFGLLGNIVSIFAFTKLWKTSKPYANQILIMGNDTFQVLCGFLIYIGDYQFNVFYNMAPSWVQRSPFLLYFFFLIFPIVNMSVFASLIQLVSVPLDRLQALYQPLVYRSVNHRRRTVKLGVFSIVVGILSSLHDCFRMKVVWANEQYYLDYNYEFINSSFATVMSIARIMFRGLLMLAMWVFSGLLIYKYRARAKTAPKNKKEKSELVSENTLTVLSLAQVTLNSLTQISAITYYIALYLTGGSESFMLYAGLVITMAASLSTSYNFLVYFALSGEFRRTVFGLFGYKQTETTVQSTSAPRTKAILLRKVHPVN